MAYWGTIRGVSDPMPIRSFGGVYKPDDEGFGLPDNLFTELINFSPDEYPAITTRPGYYVIGKFGTRVTGLGAWKGERLLASFNDGTWRTWDGSSWSAPVYTFGSSDPDTINADWSFANFKGNLPGINLFGVCSAGSFGLIRYDGSSGTLVTAAPSGARYITTHSNRLYCAVNNTLHYSALSEYDDWTTVDDAGELPVNTADGETINGISAGNGHVTVFKPSSIFEVYGKGPQSYAMDQIAGDIGVTGNKAVVTFDETLPFVGRDGVYRYSGGVRPSKDYSVPIQQFINGANKSRLSECVAGNDGKYLYFGIPYGSSGQNSRILQFDPIHQAWYTWDGIAVTQMLRIGDKMYFGDASGRVLQLGGDTDNGTKIVSTAITKPFTAGSISRKQHWFRIWVVASLTTGSSLQIYISPKASGEEWTALAPITATSDIQYKEILVPTNKVAAANAVRLKLVLTGRGTIHELCYQMRNLPMRR